MADTDTVDQVLDQDVQAGTPDTGTQDDAVQVAAPTPATDAVAADAGTADAGSQEEFLSIRDAAKEFGYEGIGQFDDDESALKHLIERASAEPAPAQNDQLLQYGQRYVDHAADFEQYMRDREQQQAAAEVKTDEPQKFWDPPEWNQSWMNQVEVDPDSGQFRPTNGGTPETVSRVQKYVQYRQDQQERFWNNPHAYFEPYLQQREDQLETRMKELVDQSMGQERTQLQTRQFVDQNAAWLYQKDAQENVVFDPQNGHPLLTEDGQRFAGYAHQLSGLPLQQQQELAMKLLEADRVLSGKSTPSTKREEKNKQILMRNANYQADTGGSQTDEGDKGAPPQNGEQDLEQMLTSALKGAGYDDKKLRDEMLGNY